MVVGDGGWMHLQTEVVWKKSLHIPFPGFFVWKFTNAEDALNALYISVLK
jgi:hypothetical protein